MALPKIKSLKDCDNDLVDSHIPMVYYAIVQLTIEVNTGAENGDGGLLEMVATSFLMLQIEAAK